MGICSGGEKEEKEFVELLLMLLIPNLLDLTAESYACRLGSRSCKAEVGTVDPKNALYPFDSSP